MLITALRLILALLPLGYALVAPGCNEKPQGTNGRKKQQWLKHFKPLLVKYDHGHYKLDLPGVVHFLGAESPKIELVVSGFSDYKVCNVNANKVKDKEETHRSFDETIKFNKPFVMKFVIKRADKELAQMKVTLTKAGYRTFGTVEKINGEWKLKFQTDYDFDKFEVEISCNGKETCKKAVKQVGQNELNKIGKKAFTAALNDDGFKSLQKTLVVTLAKRYKPLPQVKGIVDDSLKTLGKKFVTDFELGVQGQKNRQEPEKEQEKEKKQNQGQEKEKKQMQGQEKQEAAAMP